MAKKKAHPRLIATLLVAQSLIGTFTVRDLKRRSAAQVRGPKWFWYAWGGTNTAGSVAYWLIGRRR